MVEYELEQTKHISEAIELHLTSSYVYKLNLLHGTNFSRPYFIKFIEENITDFT